MTYEELFVAIDEAAPKLPGCALRLLLHLVAIAIKSGTNEVRSSVRTLATEMRMTKDAVTVASRSLAEFVEITAAPGVPTVFVLPAEWFALQRSLFAAPGPVEKIFRRPGFQDTSVRETRTPLSEKPGQSVPITRTQWATYQDTVGEKPGHSYEKPGHSVPITRTANTQNQQLTDAPAIDQSIDGVSVNRSLVVILDRIATVDRVEKHQQQDAEILRSMLSDYRMSFGYEAEARKPADDKIVARCLAAGCIETLAGTLRGMKADGLRPKPKDGWFLTLFLNKIHGIDPAITRDHLRSHFERRQPQRESNLPFAPQLVQQASAGVRHF